MHIKNKRWNTDEENYKTIKIVAGFWLLVASTAYQ